MRALTARHLRRVGGLALATALATLGVAAGVALSSPAGAQGANDIQIRMPGQGVNKFTSGATPPLLDVHDLAPGGSVTGSMQVKDNRVGGGSDATDAISLAMSDVTTSSTCPAGAGDCTNPGVALMNELQLSLKVTDDHGGLLARWSGGVSGLQKQVQLLSGLSHGDTFWVQMTAALPFGSTGDEVAYGGLGFTLQLDLASVAGTSTHTIGPHGGGHGHGSHGGGHGVAGLAVTGAPVQALAAIAGALLLAGLVLVIVARRRGRDGIADSQL